MLFSALLSETFFTLKERKLRAKHVTNIKHENIKNKKKKKMKTVSIADIYFKKL